nr:LysR family transcriptional regulator [uncultured Moellerella sp.]
MKQQSEQNQIVGRGITLEQLRTFVFIAELSSFKRAGEELGRTQSTLSAGLRRLEQDVGCRLIDRRKGHILGLTAEGLQLLPAARDILHRTNSAIGALKKSNLKGVVCLGVPDDFEVKNLHRIISLCLEENPDLRVKITAASSKTLSRLAAQQQLDIVIIKGLVGEPLLSESEKILRVEPLYWVRSKAVSFNELDEIPLVTFPEGCVIRICAMSALEHVGRRYFFSYTSGSFDNIRNAVACGLGIGLLPKNALSDDLHILTSKDGMPCVPAIQWVLSIRRPEKLYALFASYIGRGLAE